MGIMGVIGVISVISIIKGCPIIPIIPIIILKKKVPTIVVSTLIIFQEFTSLKILQICYSTGMSLFTFFEPTKP